jgi:benzoylformate decarboxylase
MTIGDVLPQMSGSHALVDLLKREGVTMLFGNPGTTELPLLDALAVDHDLRYVLGLQEAAVMAMADGYAQASGTLAVASLHLAPGLGNALGMLYNAQKASAPLLVIAGQHEDSFSATEPILSGDLPTLARPFVKWAGEVRRLRDLPRLVHRAAKTALAPPTGPVCLSLSSDVLTDEGEIDLQEPTRIASRFRGDRAAVENAATLLAKAARPVILAGDAVAQSRAHAELVELAELLGAPVYAELLPNTASFPASHPLFHGALVPRAPAVRQVLAEHDVLFSVGADLFTLSLPSGVEPMPAGMRVIHLDVDPWQLGKNYPADVAILGDPKGTLPDLLAAVRERMTIDACRAARSRLTIAANAARAARQDLIDSARALEGRSPVEPLALLHAIGTMLPKNAVVIEEATSSARGIRELILSDDPQSYFALRGGGVGWGLPAAIGVKLALPDRPVVALVGDGSAMYTCQALWTAAHHRVGVVFVILNNASYRILKKRLYDLQGRAARAETYIGTELIDPAIDFVGLARSLGVAAERAGTIADATRLIAQGLDLDGPMLVDVEIERAFKVI